MSSIRRLPVAGLFTPEIRWSSSLMGRAIEALPYFLYAFVEVGRRGLGAERGKYELRGVDLIDGGKSVQVYDGKTQTLRPYSAPSGTVVEADDRNLENLTIHFLTPLRLKEKGKLVTRLTFPILFERLARRLTLLSAFYGANGPLPDFSALQAEAREIIVGVEALHWYDWERYSRRQDAMMTFGGLRGLISFLGNLASFMPALRMGELINVGQGTTFGLGRYEIV